MTEEDLAASDTPELTGRAIAHLACDPDLLSRSGKTYPVVQLSHLYGFPDVDGVQPDLDDYTACGYDGSRRSTTSSHPEGVHRFAGGMPDSSSRM